jgi:hypothetical protein
VVEQAPVLGAPVGFASELGTEAAPQGGSEIAGSDGHPAMLSRPL